MPSKQLHNEVLVGGCETAKHHGPEGRNDLQINRKNKFPGGRNVPSEILLEILSNLAIPYPAILLEIESNPIHPMLTAAASSHALKTAHNEVLVGGCETAKHHGPEGRNGPPNQSQEQVPWRPERPF